MARRGAKRTKTERRRKASARQSRAKSNASAGAEKAKNARLARELREAQERAAATAEVLRVISTSPGDLDAVFRAMLENATRLCGAQFGPPFRYDGEKVHRMAGVGTPASLTEFQRKRDADKKLSFKCDVASNLPAGRGDGRRLTQVLLNVVGNAIKFTDAGEVIIEAGANNGSFEVAVRDTGPGISEADQAKLFQEFQQADNSITKQKGGTGLGLAISKHIIEMHGGKIGPSPW